MRVLYVDDEDDIREIAELSLGLDPEFEVRSAASGVIGEGRPHLSPKTAKGNRRGATMVFAALRDASSRSGAPAPK